MTPFFEKRLAEFPADPEADIVADDRASRGCEAPHVVPKFQEACILRYDDRARLCSAKVLDEPRYPLFGYEAASATNSGRNGIMRVITPTRASGSGSSTCTCMPHSMLRRPIICRSSITAS
jgi:hypothetical protein